MILYVDQDNNVIDVERNQSISKYNATVVKINGELNSIVEHNLNTQNIWISTNDILIDWEIVDNNKIKVIFSSEIEDGTEYNFTIFGTSSTSNSQQSQESSNNSSSSSSNNNSSSSESSGSNCNCSEEIQSIKTDINEIKENFQDGVDTLYNKAVSEGSTPSAKTPTAISNAMSNIRSGGNASASNILSGKTAYVNKQLVTGTMTNKGNQSENYLKKIMGDGSVGKYSEKTIYEGYHNGNGKIKPDYGVVFMPYLIGYDGNSNYIEFTYGDNLNFDVCYNISSGVRNINYAPYLFIAYNKTDNKICDYAIQKEQSSDNSVNGIYGNLNFRINSSNCQMHYYPVNSSYSSSARIQIRIYSLSYDITFS